MPLLVTDIKSVFHSIQSMSRSLSYPPHLPACRFPKDTPAEQIEALTDDDYVFKHLILHVSIIAVLSITAVPMMQKQKAVASKTANAKAQ